MNWINANLQNPQYSEPYIVSVSKPYGNGEFVFSYIAYYDSVTNKWHKYDPFIDPKIGDVIEDKIIAWNKGTTTFLGFV